jgi:hypothetical protein
LDGFSARTSLQNRRKCERYELLRRKRILKNIVFILSIALSNLAMSYDDYDVNDEVEAVGFVIGSDNDIGGAFYYIVDRTNGLCFAGNNFKSSAGGGSGLTSVDCEKLKSTPKINKYLSNEKID